MAICANRRYHERLYDEVRASFERMIKNPSFDYRRAFSIDCIRLIAGEATTQDMASTRAYHYMLELDDAASMAGIYGLKEDILFLMDKWRKE